MPKHRGGRGSQAASGPSYGNTNPIESSFATVKLRTRVTSARHWHSSATAASTPIRRSPPWKGSSPERGTAPAFIRCDNGPELTANASKGLVPVLARRQRIHREEPDDRAAHGRRVAARRAARPRGHPDLARRRPRRAQVSRMTRTITAMTRAMMAIVRVFMRRLPVVEQDASKAPIDDRNLPTWPVLLARSPSVASRTRESHATGP